MAQEAKKTQLELAKERYDVAIAKANTALIAKPVDFAGYASAIGELEQAEKDYATLAANAMYDEYAGKENPIIEIIKAYSYKTVGHKEKRNKDDNNRVVSVDPVEKDRQIDLLAFCNRAKLDTDWQYTASRFNQLMCLRAAKELGANVNTIAKSYFLKDAVKKIEMGATPTSNTQVCKLLQRVIDEMLPNEDSNGKAIYKCNNYDVRYLDDLYGKKSNKAMLTVRVSNDAFLRRILVDIAFRLITNGKYGVDGYKTVKQENK
jgi:hypothetical protein